MSIWSKIKKFVIPRKYPPRGTPLDSVGMWSRDGSLHMMTRRYADGKGGSLPLSDKAMELLGYTTKSETRVAEALKKTTEDSHDKALPEDEG